MTTADQDARLTALEQRVTRLELELTGARPLLLEIYELVKGLPYRFDRIDDRFERIDKRFDRVDERLDTIEQAIRARGSNGTQTP
jgi:hypothetical protein